MADEALRLTRRYETTLDRAGLAIAAGGALVGVLTTILVLVGGQRDPISLALAFVLGTVFAVIGITAVAGPAWLAMHLAGYRGPAQAALLAAICSLVVFAAGQTYGFGLFDMPVTDTRTLIFRYVSAFATATVLALVAALIGVVMWRLAYRRVR